MAMTISLCMRKSTVLLISWFLQPACLGMALIFMTAVPMHSVAVTCLILAICAITVSPAETSVEYIQMVEGGGTGNGQVAYSYSIEAAIPESSITVTSPNGGENWIAGSAHNINWTSTGTVGDVRIDYSTDNGSSWVAVTPNTANDGAYTWNVSNLPSSVCLIRVSETDGNPADVSNSAFTISPVTFTLNVANDGNGTVVLNPAGGTYNANTTVTLTPVPGSGYVFDSWSGANAGDVVETGGVYTIQMDGNKSVTANFSQVPVITVTSPNGGQNWLAGSSRAITWTSVNASGTVHIEYSTNNGTEWTDIETSATNNGSYAWTIPNTLSVTCLVRISDTDGSPADASDAVFSIVSSLEQHFIPVWSNNGYEHMNFYAATAKIDNADLQPGDEIGIFDGNACVGMGIITQVLDGHISSSASRRLKMMRILRKLTDIQKVILPASGFGMPVRKKNTLR